MTRDEILKQARPRPWDKVLLHEQFMIRLRRLRWIGGFFQQTCLPFRLFPAPSLGGLSDPLPVNVVVDPFWASAAPVLDLILVNAIGSVA